MGDGGDNAAMPYQVLADAALPDEMLSMLAVDCTVHVWPADAADLAPLLARPKGSSPTGTRMSTTGCWTACRASG